MAVAQLLPKALHLQRMHVLEFGRLPRIVAHLQARLVHADDQAEIERAQARRHLRDARFIELPDAGPPLRHRALMPPVFERIPRGLHIRDAAQEERHDESLVRQRHGDVVPELAQRLRLLRPQRDRLGGFDLPLRVQAHHVLVKDLAGEHHALVALLQLREVVFLVGGQRTAELLRDHILKVLLRRMRRRQRATRLATLHRDERCAQGEVFQIFFTRVALAQPAARRLQPAHVRRLLVQLHLRHHLVLEQVDAEHRVIVHEPFRLLAQAWIELLEQRGDFFGEGGHAIGSAREVQNRRERTRTLAGETLLERAVTVFFM